MSTAPDGERGFALIAVLFALMILSFFAYGVLAADRGSIAGLAGQLHRARLEAAADAGVATALEAIGRSGGDRWAADGRTHAFEVDGAAIDAVVEDVRGLVPVSYLTPDQARRLLIEAGVRGAALDRLTASLLNWEDGGERDGGARRLDYAASGLRLRQGPLQRVDELAALPGMTPDILARMAPLVSTWAPRGGFDPAAASAAAIRIMGEDAPAGPHGAPVDLVARPLRIRVTARDGGGGVFHRTYVAELTGQPHYPVYVRSAE